MSNFKEKIYAIVFGEHNTRSKDKSEQEVIDRVEETYRKEYDYFMVVHELNKELSDISAKLAKKYKEMEDES
tara:strand:- start:276 stop:491 length:216 start_codon:yes stop_codon:yes gene_type:complete